MLRGRTRSPVDFSAAAAAIFWSAGLKFKMAEKSLFAVLLRKPWWVSLCVAGVMGAVAAALMPADFKVAGALSATPFAIISLMAAKRQWRAPSQGQIEQTMARIAGMNWATFAPLVQQALERDGYRVTRAHNDAFDFEIERGGRHALLAARRWKTARMGMQVLQSLHEARQARNVPDAVLICPGELTDNARPFAVQHRIAVWQGAALTRLLGKF
jgi:restriction system protein